MGLFKSKGVPPKDDITEEIKKPNFTGDISRWDFSPAANMDWVFDKVVPYVFTTDIPKLYLEGISSSPPKEVTGVQSNQARDMVTSKTESLRQAQESSGSKLTKAARKIGWV